ncbi:hypothetical protein [uncultured Sporomusa sp.]|uniref:hypothetical protein n=1 Tax=uncultured Sporomusa sp. TaxID=307249 RepID=UPI00258B60DE|nr:hypothetical protein [uncultured Sporomusa sp.]
MDDVFTDVFGKSATCVLDALLEHGNGHFELNGLLSAKCKSSPEKVRAALDGELDPIDLKKRRGGKKAVIAIARKLLTAIWHILSKNEAYNAELYRKADKPPTAHELTTAQAVTLLRSKGFVIVDEKTGEVA